MNGTNSEPKPNQSNQSNPGESGTQLRKRKRILIVESDGFTRMVLMLLFRMVGFAVDFTANGLIARGKLRRNPPDALLLELRLSGLYGMELIREALGDSKFRLMRIYVFTDVELLKKAKRREVFMSATKVFDKRAMSRENVVKSIIADLMAPKDTDTSPTLLVSRAQAKLAEAAQTNGVQPTATPPPEQLEPEPEPEPEIAAGTLLPEELDEIVDGVRVQSELVLKSKDIAERQQTCRELLSRVCSLRSCAEAGGLLNLTRHAQALEGFLTQLCQDGKQLAQASLTTVSRAVALLHTLAQGSTEKRELTQFSAAIIDESPSSSQSLSEALRKVGVKVTTFTNAPAAREHLAKNPENLIIVNASVPELHGVDETGLKQLPLQAATPIIFVSDSSAADSSKEQRRPETPLVNSNPLLMTELVMKALNEVQSKDGAPETPAPAQEPPATDPTESTPPTAESPAEANEEKTDSEPTPANTDETSSPTRVETNQAAAEGPSVTDEEAAPETEAAALETAPIEPATPEATAAEPVQAEAAETEPINSEPADSVAEEDEPEPVVEETEEPIANARAKTILFVEDDPFALKVYRKGLKRAGFQVEVAEDGLAAIDVLSRNRPDLVVLDLMLPELPGLEVLRYIRAENNSEELPVIVLSNAYVNELAQEAIDAGANRGLLKTDCTPAKLVEQVCELLGQSDSAAALDYEPEGVQLTTEVDLIEETAIWTRQAGLREQAPKEVARIRQMCLGYIKTADDQKSPPQLMDLYRRVRFLSAHAALIGFTKIADVSSALEGLLFDLVCRNAAPTSSTFQTLAQAVDLLDQLVKKNDTTFVDPGFKHRVLVLDEDGDANASLASALQRGNFEVLSTQDPAEGLGLLKNDSFDLVLLEVDMPHMSGFEVCENLRRMPEHKSVPVLFVAANAGFQERARSVISGGNDLIGKPVSPQELILKAKLHLLKDSGRSLAAEPARTEVARSEQPNAAPAVSWVTEPIVAQRETSLSTDKTPAPGLEAASTALPAMARLASEVPQEAKTDQVLEENEKETSLAVSTGAVVEEPSGDLTLEMAKVEVSDPSNRVAERLGSIGQAEAESLAVQTPEVVEPATPVPTGAENESGESLTAEARIAALPGDPEAVRDPLEALRQEYAEVRENLSKREQERQTLVDRVYTSENDLHRAEKRLERSKRRIEELQQELETAKATQPGPEVQQRVKDLENDLARRTAELESARVESEKEAAEREKEFRCRAEELQAARTKAEKEAEEQMRAQTELRRQLETAINEAQRDRQEIQSRCSQSEQEAARLRQARKDLNARVAKERQLNAQSEKRVKELESQAKEQARTETSLRQQLEAATETSKRTEAAREEVQSRVSRLEQELVAARQTGEQLNCKVSEGQQASAAAQQQIQQLQKDLSQRAAELEQARAQTEKQAGQSRTQLEAAVAAGQQSKAAHQQAQARVVQLEQELAAARQAGEQLNCKVSEGQQASAAAQQQIQQLQKDLSQRAAELEQARAQAEKQSDQSRTQLEAAAAAGQQSKTAHQQAQARVVQLEQELAAARRVGEQLNCKVSEGRQASVAAQQQIQQLQKDLSQRAAELEQARAQAEKEATQLRTQLEAAATAGQQSKAAHQQTHARVVQLEQELAAARRVGEQLNCKVSEGQQVSAAAQQQIQQLQKDLSQRAAELEQARAQAEKQADQSRTQLEAAAAAGQQSKAAHQQAQARVVQLEQELAAARQAGEQLNCKVSEGQQASAAAEKRIQQLQQELAERASKQEQARGEAEKQATQLRTQLEAAVTAGQQSKAAHQQAQVRVVQLEQELAAARQAGEQLNCKVSEGHQASAVAQQQIQQLQKDLAQRAAELEQARTQAEKQADQSRTHMEAAVAAAHQQVQARVVELEQELAAARQAGEQLNCKVSDGQQASAAAEKRIQELEQEFTRHASELERARAEASKQGQQHAEAQSELLRQLDLAAKAGAQSQEAHKETQARVALLTKELAVLRLAGEQLTHRVAEEQQAKAQASRRIEELQQDLIQHAAQLDRAKAEAAQQVQEHGQAQSELRRQLEAAALAGTQSQAAHEEAQSRVAQLSEEVASLRRIGEQLNCKVAEGQQASMAAEKRIQELEENLNQRVTELKRANAEAAQKAQEHSRAQSDLQRQLEVAIQAGKQTDAARQESQRRVAQQDLELAALREVREQLASKVANEQQAKAAAGERIQELERDLNRLTTDLERSRTDGAKQAEEYSRIRSELGAKLEATDAARSLAQAQVSQLQQEVATLRQAQDNLAAKLSREQEGAGQLRRAIKELETRWQSDNAAHQAHVSEFEQRLAQGVAALAHVTSELAQERGEHQRSEERASSLNVQLRDLYAQLSRSLESQRADQERIGKLEGELRQREEAIAGYKADVEQQTAECRLAKDQLQRTAALNAHYRKNLLFFEDAHRTVTNAHKELQSRFDATLSSAQEIGTRLQHETAERQRFATALEGAQRDIETQCRKRQRLEVELQSALQARAEAETRLQHETAERHQLAGNLEGVQHDLEAQTRKREALEGELHSTLWALQEGAAKLQQEMAERQRLASTLETVQNDLQAQSRKREALETELQSTLQELHESTSKLHQEAAERQRLGSALDNALGDLRTQNQKRELLETDAQKLQQALRESESKADRAANERQQLDEALSSAQLKLHEQSQRTELELNKLQSAFQLEQVERKRRETQLARMRHFSLETARGARALRNTLQRQAREPMESLQESAQRLLQLELGSEQKKLAEAVLHDALLVHSRLREAGVAQRPLPQPAPNSGNGDSD